jgi:putative transposase
MIAFAACKIPQLLLIFCFNPTLHNMSGSSYRIRDQYGTHFITCTIVDWIDIFTRKECKDIIVASLNHCAKNKALVVNAWCLMSNHLHLVVRAGGEAQLSEIIRDFKKWTARELIAWLSDEHESRREWMDRQFRFHGKFRKNVDVYHIWDDDNHPILLEHEKIFYQKIHYTHMNPVRAGIVELPEQYLHSSARDYLGTKGLVEVVVP